ncbi:MAG: GPR endopeptidase, partial [Clostridiales bacterium]|nr:GPR endopeptidase [Clostridiales bacterium]
AAGVLGTTGMESGEVVRALTDRLRPGLVIAVDALAARSVRRLCSTVQIADTGIIPGSGVGNARQALNRETLGVPVIALGVPTVVDAATLASDLTGGEREEPEDGELSGMLVTPKDIDVLVSDIAKVIGYGVNLALQEGLTVEDVDLFLS